MMLTPAWQVITWRPVCATLEEWARYAKKLQHIGISVHVADKKGGLRHGQVLWAVDLDGQKVGMAWDWCEVMENVIAMADPMTILSNVTLFDDQGECLRDHQRIVTLNDTIYRLNWQAHVCANRGSWAEALAA